MHCMFIVDVIFIRKKYDFLQQFFLIFFYFQQSNFFNIILCVTVLPGDVKCTVYRTILNKKFFYSFFYSWQQFTTDNVENYF